MMLLRGTQNPRRFEMAAPKTHTQAPKACRAVIRESEAVIFDVPDVRRKRS